MIAASYDFPQMFRDNVPIFLALQELLEFEVSKISSNRVRAIPPSSRELFRCPRLGFYQAEKLRLGCREPHAQAVPIFVLQIG